MLYHTDFPCRLVIEPWVFLLYQAAKTLSHDTLDLILLYSLLHVLQYNYCTCALWDVDAEAIYHAATASRQSRVGHPYRSKSVWQCPGRPGVWSRGGSWGCNRCPGATGGRTERCTATERKTARFRCDWKVVTNTVKPPTNTFKMYIY